MLNNKKGFNTIVYVVFLFIVLSVVVGYVNILSRTHILNEIQANMDNVGLAVLQSAFNSTALREEILEIDRVNYGLGSNVYKTNYANLIKSDYERKMRELTSRNDYLLDYNIVFFDVYFKYDRIPHLDNAPKLQIVIDAVTVVTISSNSIMTKNNSTFNFTDTLGVSRSLSHTENGNVSVYHVRSVVRSFYE